MSGRFALGRARCWALAGAIAALIGAEAAAQGGLPPGFVFLRDVDPSIAQDIRYAGADNFVGRPLSGYDAAECVLRREVAAALKRVQVDLRQLRLALKVYDCYRPERAARAMAQWATDGRSELGTKRFFPRVEKRRLFALGYIAASSRHSAGTAVDLTLIEADGARAAAFDPTARYAPCTGPAGQRSPDNSIDMGTGYDCFDVNSHMASHAITAEQQKRRALLVSAMKRHGFSNYFREWWHFSFPAAATGWHHDFPIPRRQAKAHAE